MEAGFSQKNETSTKYNSQSENQNIARKQH